MILYLVQDFLKISKYLEQGNFFGGALGKFCSISGKTKERCTASSGTCVGASRNMIIDIAARGMPINNLAMYVPIQKFASTLTLQEQSIIQKPQIYLWRFSFRRQSFSLQVILSVSRFDPSIFETLSVSYTKIRRVHSVGSNVANSIRFALFVSSDFFDSIGRIVECRIFDIRRTLLRIGFFRFDRPHSRISNIRYSIGRPSNVEYSTSEAPQFGY